MICNVTDDDAGFNLQHPIWFLEIARSAESGVTLSTDEFGRGYRIEKRGNLWGWDVALR